MVWTKSMATCIYVPACSLTGRVNGMSRHAPSLRPRERPKEFARGLTCVENAFVVDHCFVPSAFAALLSVVSFFRLKTEVALSRP